VIESRINHLLQSDLKSQSIYKGNDGSVDGMMRKVQVRVVKVNVVVRRPSVL
jgi:hypothetical protein